MPASDSIVGRKSMKLTNRSSTSPARVRSGKRTIIGTRIPAS
jgi:hypothetical protein